MCDNKVADKVKRKLYKTMLRPVMLYGMEAVAMTKRQEEKMGVAEMKLLRCSLVLTKLDRVRNEMVI